MRATIPHGRWMILGSMGIVFPAVILACFTGFGILGIHHSIGIVLPLSLAAMLAGSLALMIRSGLTIRQGSAICLMFVAVTGISLVLAGIFYDESKDGRWYHQEAVIRLADGFDPIRDTLEEDSIPGGVWSVRSNGSHFESAMLWVNRYPKGNEILAACVYSATGEIETGKLFNFSILLSVAMLLGAFLVGSFPAMRRSTAGALTAMAVLCPVVLSQSWTYYVDGQMHLLQLALGVFLILAVRERRIRWMSLAGIALVLLANLKFTGVVNGILFLSVALLHLLSHRRFRDATRLVLTSTAFLIVGIGIVGFNPYVRNLVEKGHPLHPLMGREKIDIMAPNAPSDFLAKDRFTKFAISALSPTSHLFPVDGSSPAPKIPFTIRRSEIEALRLTDPRLAGFGPFFAPLLILSGLLYLWTWVARWRKAKTDSRLGRVSESPTWADWCVLAIGATVLVNPESWWARYVPQLWLLPALFLWSGLDRFGPKGRKWLPRIAMGMYAVPLLPLVPVLILSNARDSMIVERDLQRLRGAHGVQIFYGDEVGDRAKFRSEDFHLQAVPSRAELAGEHTDLLVCGGRISYSDPALESAFHSSSSGLSRKLILDFCRHRIFWFLG